jgi:hypothetical protein
MGQRCRQFRPFYPWDMLLQICVVITLLSIWIARKFCRICLIRRRKNYMHVACEMISPFVPQAFADSVTIIGRWLTLWTRHGPLNVNGWRRKRILSAGMRGWMSAACGLQRDKSGIILRSRWCNTNGCTVTACGRALRDSTQRI